MTITAFLEKLDKGPHEISFHETMAVIDVHYNFRPIGFTNGNLVNVAGQNTGSCKLFSFAKLQGLNVDDTLSCFGDYYRVDVLENPDKEDHQNIRNFMKTGWEGMTFEQDALTKK